MFSDTDHAAMAQALALAERGMYTTTPNPRVGCVLSKDGKIIGQGFTQPAGQDHAEIQALKDAAARGNDPKGATAFVTLEPCSHFGRTPPCADALVRAGIARVVAAMEDPNPTVSGRGLQRLREAGVDVRCGLLEKEARELNIGFVNRMTRGLPWVRIKVAASLDGGTALHDGSSQWITGQAARDDGHAWRARASAILTGIGTVRDDNPQLNVRAVDTPRQPQRVVVDSRLEIPLDARLLTPDTGDFAKPVLVFCAFDDTARRRALEARGAEVVVLPNPHGKVELRHMLEELGRRGINELHVEAGFKLNGSLIREHCADELLIYLAPKLLGDAQGMFQLPPLARLQDAAAFRWHDVRMIGEDLRLIARRADHV
ncbi:bifunctional diaminohydroxyphosphoribosylaminopyrimidine deaminase/5-amino-6-(5-phosphoribosylamino)uracil reductase RibD [Cupriavidus basilensis]|uniref:bifunctional diaminohydroxyphosphoribosylaminopyrimidine deaminase/5-amino-6-(5-phosphoribosylamino)uracil reductase RibD n=1 Tax=Cupriavidus basilensis TaxID=68895 RepID=UPI0020A6D4C7|nr:bifunctional diaminohydroxyphosphoribosylaminopyrimidine deaminase/5-amino-6-(5-phosphoribosylamino)uracil reductase RibD [Cupriavidus basilensis]MCP3019273.1 bifunctional diaminohydroxyphosphoribosylaminopyrimidine deaminase/5-amino-6-(5-phosphoribosylamino)uracil reductase RibD [Cupriavidus basilensis]MDR3380729.1 bifunctional diaminohydroxyphosphoribosylaminopyrimidine deaminase/5-amino-6-(5-phosphoribosylamino)uracil reductase RibD [Cupriavidus basilensis]